jgi:transcriptional regulator with XRE-family HTH domain
MANAVLRLYGEEKLSVAEVARRLDLDMTAVWRFLRRRDVVIEWGRGKKRGRKPMAADRVAEVLRLAAAGLALSAVATRTGLHRNTVDRILKEHHAPPPSGRPPWDPGPEQLAQAARLYVVGWSLRRLGARFGVSDKTIARRLRAAGVNLRGVGRPRKTPGG